MQKKLFGILILLLLPFSANATTDIQENITLILDDRMVTLNFETQPTLLEKVARHYLVINDQKFPVDFVGTLPEVVNDYYEIETHFETRISPQGLHRFFEDTFAFNNVSDETVEIRFDKFGQIVFDGTPKNGLEVDEIQLANLINDALEKKQKYVRVPARKQYSQVVVHPDLEARGIKEVIAVGHSNFAGSSAARRQNIRAASRKFNGHIISKWKEFSFNKVLKRVDERDGFVRELVIIGNTLTKELGGGTCQVSTTAFRAAYLAGFPLTSRRGHSYAVPYYQPPGLDASIYLGSLDFRFINDSMGDVLIQTFIDGDDLYFAFYGTSDDRKVALEGPFISNFKKAPRPRYILTDTLAPGRTHTVFHGHDGFQSKWMRRIEKNGEVKRDWLVSDYRPWQAKILIGRKELSVSADGDNHF